MEQKLRNRKVAILATNGFEQSELFSPKEALENAGADVSIISPESGRIKAWDKGNWGKEIAVDQTIDQADPADYDALVLPGGVMNPDKLRANEKAVDFVTHFLRERKPVGAICHGPWTLIETGRLNGRKMTSYHTIKTDLKNAGVNWVDEEVVVDDNLVTSRKPDDLSAFNDTLIEKFSEDTGRQRRGAMS